MNQIISVVDSYAYRSLVWDIFVLNFYFALNYFIVSYIVYKGYVGRPYSRRLLISLVLPVSAGLGYDASGAPAASTATVITLSLMHVVSYAISVPFYIRMGLR